MSKIIYKFMKYIENNPELREEFESCKDLKESYDKFKSKLNGCTYDEYRSFFEKIYLENCNELSYEDLEQVTGGISPLGMKILTPIMLMTMFVDASAKFVFAHGESSEGSTGNSSTVAQVQAEEDGHKSKLPEEGKINDIKYRIRDDCIIISGNKRIPLENVDIPEELLEEGKSKPFEIGGGIRSIKLAKGVTIKNIRHARDLDSIDTSKSDKYVFENSALYERNGTSTERNVVDVLMEGTINNVKYKIYRGFIRIFGDIEDPLENVDIPEELLEAGKSKPFQIDYGIRSIKLAKGVTIKNISKAWDLESIDTSKSDKYVFENSALYERNGTSTERNVVGVLTKGTINNVKYEIKGRYIKISGDEKNPQDIDIPDELIAECLSFSIGKGIRSVKLKKGVTIQDLCSACDLESIDARESDEYVFDGKTLYERTAGKKVGMIGKGTIKGIKYEIRSDYIEISGDEKNPLENVVIPEKLLEKGGSKPFSIGEGIRSIKLKEGLTIRDLDLARDLESIDAKDSNNYIFENGVLYEKIEKREKGKCVALLSKGTINGIKYTIQDDYIEISGDEKDHLENVEIPEKLLVKGGSKPFEIGRGIRSIKLAKGTTIRSIRYAWDLENIDTKESDNYIFEGSALYKKTEKREKGERIELLPEGTINDIKYMILFDCIEISGDRENPQNINDIPEELLEEGKSKPFKIGDGIRSIKLAKGVTIKGIRLAYHLEYILVDNLDDYIIEEDVLYKKENGVKGEKVCPLERSVKVVDSLPIDTTESEISFSLEKLHDLPVQGEEFEEYKKPLDRDKLEENRREGDKIINEKRVYNEMKKVVDSIIEKVNSRTHSKHRELPKKLRIAKAIYRWIAKNIKYLDIGENQDAIHVFARKQGVCRGYSALVVEMMRMAGIPCIDIYSTMGKESPNGHAYNAVYIDDTVRNKVGWTLMDVTWASGWASMLSGGSETSGEGEATAKAAARSVAKKYFKKYFPGFYSKNTIEEDNKSIIRKEIHKIWCFKDARHRTRYTIKPTIIGNLEYHMYGHEGKSYLVLKGHGKKPMENVEIPEGLLKYKDKMPFSIGRNIKSIKLAEGVTIKDISEAWSLKNIDVNDKYIFENGVLYEKTSSDQKGDKVSRLPKYENNVFYQFKDDCIEILANKPQENVTIPDDVLAEGKPFTILNGIRSIKLPKGATIKSIKYARDLESIDVKDSDEYDFENYVLYKKAKAPAGRERVCMLPSGTIKGIKYQIRYKNIYISADKNNPLEDVTIPDELLAEQTGFSIGAGIKSIKLTKGVTIKDIKWASNLEYILVDNLNDYIIGENAIYEKKADGAKGEMVCPRELESGDKIEVKEVSES